MNNILKLLIVIIVFILYIGRRGRCRGFKKFEYIKTNFNGDINLNDYTLIQDKPLSIIFKNFLEPKLFNQNVDEYNSNKHLLEKRVVLNTDILHTNVLINKKMLITDIFHSKKVQQKISEKLGLEFKSSNVYDPYNNFIQTSTKSGEGLDWHYDQHFFKGKVLVGLYTLINRNKDNTDLSSQKHTQDLNDGIKVLDVPENSFVLFEASQINHTTQHLKQGEERVVYQTTYSSDISQNIMDKLKMMFGTSESLNILIETFKMGI